MHDSEGFERKDWLDVDKSPRDVDGSMAKIADAYLKNNPEAKLTPLSEFPKVLLTLTEKEDRYFDEFLSFIYKPTQEITQMMAPRSTSE